VVNCIYNSFKDKYLAFCGEFDSVIVVDLKIESIFTEKYVKAEQDPSETYYNNENK